VDHVTPSIEKALQMAYEKRDRELAEVFLQHGANMNVSMPGKGTPMHNCMQKERRRNAQATSVIRRRR
jgi:hypothetical protein